METVFPIFFVLFIFIITYVVVSASRKSDAVVLKSKYSSLSSWSSFLIIIAIFFLAYDKDRFNFTPRLLFWR